MGDNKISDEVIRDLFLRNGFTIKEGQDDLKPYVYAAARELIDHLQGEAVPVAHGWLVARPDVSPFFVPATHPHIIESFQNALAVECGTTVTPVYLHPQPAELSEVPPELADAIAAGNGTLHGAIDYWQDRALAAEAKLSEVSGGSGELPPLPAMQGFVSLYGMVHAYSAEQMQDYARAALAATGKQQVGEVHPDDQAVDAFAVAMKEKMAVARAKGRGGWEDPAQCSADDLSRMLRDHVEKGDPRDVANFCMMLHQRGEAIAPKVGEVQGEVQGDALSVLVQLAEVNRYCHRRFRDYEGPADCAVQAVIAALASRQPVGAQGIDLEDVLHKAVDLARGGSSAIAVVGWITSELLDGRDAGAGVGS